MLIPEVYSELKKNPVLNETHEYMKYPIMNRVRFYSTEDVEIVKKQVIDKKNKLEFKFDD